MIFTDHPRRSSDFHISGRVQLTRGTEAETYDYAIAKLGSKRGLVSTKWPNHSFHFAS